MIRVDVGPRLSRSARKFGDQIIAEVEAELTLVSRHFGEPRRHSGVGLRKLGRRSFEARVSRGLRIVFIREPDRLTAYDLMDHHQVTQWSLSRPSGYTFPPAMHEHQAAARGHQTQPLLFTPSISNLRLRGVSQEDLVPADVIVLVDFIYLVIGINHRVDLDRGRG